MTFEHLVSDIVEFVRIHDDWAPVVAFLVAFGESFAFISLLLPGWAILVGIGALIGAAGVEFWPVWLGAAAGAALGDWISFWLGYRFKNSITHVWPLSKNPDIVRRGHAFFERWGAWGIFIGRFFGPLRAVVPLIAGIFEMPFFVFQMANISSALVWAFVLLAPVAAALNRFIGT